jgi:hypothetical protein
MNENGENGVIKDVKTLTPNTSWVRCLDKEGAPREGLVKGIDLERNRVIVVQFFRDPKLTRVSYPPSKLRKIPRPRGA